jgi:hypothetical protein
MTPIHRGTRVKDSIRIYDSAVTGTAKEFRSIDSASSITLIGQVPNTPQIILKQGMLSTFNRFGVVKLSLIGY